MSLSNSSPPAQLEWRAENQGIDGRLRKWNLGHADLLAQYCREAGAVGAMQAIMHSRNLIDDQLIAIGRLNSITVGAGWEPPVHLGHGVPFLYPSIRPILSRIFRPATYPEHILGDARDVQEAFSNLVSLEVAAALQASQQGDPETGKTILGRLHEVGIDVDVETGQWKYCHMPPQARQSDFEAPHYRDE